eukprot:m.136678 g.136678  ORF g.136678 m.136678 type:complete len:106 (+) comp13145_c0_seq3:1402-1719(+)
MGNQQHAEASLSHQPCPQHHQTCYDLYNRFWPLLSPVSLVVETLLTSTGLKKAGFFCCSGVDVTACVGSGVAGNSRLMKLSSLFACVFVSVFVCEFVSLTFSMPF